MKDAELKQLEAIDNVLVQKLLKEYVDLTSSPVFPAWYAMKKQIDTFTEEMATNPIGIRSKNPKKKAIGKKDESDPVTEAINDEKDFAKADKVMDKLLDWVKKLQALYMMMAPAEKQKADLSKNNSEQVYT